jgi:hypothetical protein
VSFRTPTQRSGWASSAIRDSGLPPGTPVAFGAAYGWGGWGDCWADQKIGSGLAERIHCLATASAANHGPGRVVVCS